MKNRVTRNFECFKENQLKILQQEIRSKNVLGKENVQGAVRAILLDTSDCLLTPLTVIKAATEYLLLDTDTISKNERNELLKMILDHSEKLNQKITQLLKRSKNELDSLK
jgi:K+-sensing histidine kinase KdpD